MASSTRHNSSQGRILDRVGSGGRAAPRGCRLTTSTAGGLLAAGCWPAVRLPGHRGL